MLRSIALLTCLVMPLASCSREAKVKTPAQLDAEIRAAEKELDEAGKAYDRASAAFNAVRNHPSHETEKWNVGEAGVNLEQAEVKVRVLKAEKAALTPGNPEK